MEKKLVNVNLLGTIRDYLDLTSPLMSQILGLREDCGKIYGTNKKDNIVITP